MSDASLLLGVLAAVVATAAGMTVGCAAEPVASGAERAGRVTRVVDGDTAIVAFGSGPPERVRYIGIDTPESVKPDTPPQCFGKQASERNRQLVEGRAVRLEFDAERRDDYGRLLAYVFRVGDGRFVNGELVSGGFARARRYGVNTRRAGELERLQAAARAAGRGLWGRC